MTVLRDTAGDQHGCRNDAGCEESDEDQVRPRLGDDADERGEHDHQRDIVADPVVDIDEFRDDAQQNEHAEGPCEDFQRVARNHVGPPRPP